MWGDKGAAPPRGVRPSPRLKFKTMAAINFVEYRRIERYADRVTMEPICTEYLNDKELEMLKQSLKKQGYKYIGRSKDRYDNYYTSYERKSEYSTESCEIIIKAIITRLK